MFVLFILIAFSISSVWGVYKKERESAELSMQALRERTELNDRRSVLESDLASLKTDRGIEESLRKQYALAESGENLIVIVDPQTPAPIKATSTVREWLRKAFWRF